jgi:putative oxidoreductase
VVRFYGEVAAGVELLYGVLTTMQRIGETPLTSLIGDLITRFSGITMCRAVTGLIWVFSKQDRLIEMKTLISLSPTFHVKF